MDIMDDEPPPEPRDGWLLIRVHVPELNIHKSLQFPSDNLIWDVKQQVLASLPKELKECFNYGLFCPPSNGKAGKFLDEERRLGDYPFNGPIGYLELKYKRRVYKMLNLDEKQLKALHTRANLRRFLDCVNGGYVEKIAKMCAKGLDPNFHCPETGETPLTLATGAKKPNKLLIALVNGGALLDYRTKDGSTALHKAVEKDCLEAVSTLLELGASPNYKDGRGLTAVYLTVTKKTDPKICEVLLHDHASLGGQDSQGWQEVHQACRNGLVHHLEHLLCYGADMNSRNASGNTPLHVCAVNSQEACARMLLFRGADRSALNYANQTPHQVAVIAGNLELAEMIQNYKSEDIVPFRGPPRYNPRRRSGIGWLSGGGLNQNNSLGPPSPCPSDHPFSSASSSLSEGSSSHRSHEDDISIVTDKSIGDTSDIISDSSGVGTNSDSAACSIGHPSTTVVCMESYNGSVMGSGHLNLQKGDVIEVVGSTDCGLLEGYVRGSNRSGFFPVHVVQEVNLRQKNVTTVSVSGPPYNENGQLDEIKEKSENHQQNQYHPQFNSATAPRVRKIAITDARTVTLHRAKRGFGFVLRGAKASSPLMQLKPSDRCPALQYLDDVDPGGVADLAGLKPGDYLLEINGYDVRAASHEQVVDMIRSSGPLVTMTVVSQLYNNIIQSQNVAPMDNMMPSRQCATLPRKFNATRQPAPMPPRRDPKTTLSVGRARAKSMVAGLEGDKDDIPSSPKTKSSSSESINHQSQSELSTPTQTGPSTPVQLRTASIKARPTSSRITTAELEELFQRQQGESTAENRYSTMMLSSHFQSGTDSGAATPPTSPLRGPIVYASVAEMKRKKTKNGTLRGKPCSIPVINSDLKRNFHSTPDLVLAASNGLSTSTSSLWTGTIGGKSHRSQDDMHTLHASMQRLNLPPPTHPPPPPPIGQVVKVDVSRSEYESTKLLKQKALEKANSQKMAQDSSVVSSFRPAANAKLYASPNDLRAVAGYQARTEMNNRNTMPSHQLNGNAQQGLKTNANNLSAQTPLPQPPTSVVHQHNPYAQPCRSILNKAPTRCMELAPMPIPNIPEPDYSLSESDGEDENSIILARNTAINAMTSRTIIIENSGNSNTSGSSSGSGSMSHSFSVNDIQKMRSKLKSSRSYPNDLLRPESAEVEGDNSSSGVSGDQEVTISMMSDLKQTLEAKKMGGLKKVVMNSSIIEEDRNTDNRSPSPPPSNFQRHNSLTRKQAANIAMARTVGSRPAVSLSQLPPPMETEVEHETNGNCSAPVNGQQAENIVLAPPPQFCDKTDHPTGHRVRIVGAVPKTLSR